MFNDGYVESVNGQKVVFSYYYGCTRCQKHHFDHEPLFKEHRHFESKHGLKRMRTEDLIRVTVKHG